MSDFTIETLDTAALSPRDVASLAALTHALQAEEDPDEPPPSEAAVARDLRVPRVADADNHDLVARVAGGAVVGHAWMILSRDGSNAHVADVRVMVRPDARRRGVGSALLRRVAEVAASDGRTVLMEYTSDRVPSGAAFARRIGAAPLFTGTGSRLYLRDVDRARVDRWIREGPARAPGYRLIRIEGPIPEPLAAAFVDLAAVMAESPLGDLDWEHERLTVAKLRAREDGWARRQRRVRTLIARHDASGELAGFTQVLLPQDRPHAVIQNETGVRPEHRGQGLGKWLKAAMLLQIMEEAPQAVYIEAGNAASNAPMLAINEALGFRPFQTLTVWQVPVAQVLQRLR